MCLYIYIYVCVCVRVRLCMRKCALANVFFHWSINQMIEMQKGKRANGMAKSSNA